MRSFRVRRLPRFLKHYSCSILVTVLKIYSLVFANELFGIASYLRCARSPTLALSFVASLGDKATKRVEVQAVAELYSSVMVPCLLSKISRSMLFVCVRMCHHKSRQCLGIHR